MQTLDQALKDLVTSGKITREQALIRTTNPRLFEGSQDLDPPRAATSTIGKGDLHEGVPAWADRLHPPRRLPGSAASGGRRPPVEIRLARRRADAQGRSAQIARSSASSPRGRPRAWTARAQAVRGMMSGAALDGRCWRAIPVTSSRPSISRTARSNASGTPLPRHGLSPLRRSPGTRGREPDEALSFAGRPARRSRS